MARIPLHHLLDRILGFSLRDLVLETPEEVEAFKKMLDEKIMELEAKKAAAGASNEHDGGEKR